MDDVSPLLPFIGEDLVFLLQDLIDAVVVVHVLVLYHFQQLLLYF